MSRLMFSCIVVLGGIIGVMVYTMLASSKQANIPVDEKHNIVIRFNGVDKDIPKDGQLLLIKMSLEDTIVVEPASLDDCRRILEENGQG